MLKIGAVYRTKKLMRTYWDPNGGMNIEKGQLVMFLKNGVPGRSHEYYFLYDNKIVFTYYYGGLKEYFELIC